MNTKNKDIRIAAKLADIPMYRIAEEMGVSENTLFRYLRHDMKQEHRQTIMDIIQRHKQEASL